MAFLVVMSVLAVILTVSQALPLKTDEEAIESKKFSVRASGKTGTLGHFEKRQAARGPQNPFSRQLMPTVNRRRNTGDDRSIKNGQNVPFCDQVPNPLEVQCAIRPKSLSSILSTA